MKTWAELCKMTQAEQDAYLASPEAQAEIEACKREKEVREASEREAHERWFAANQPGWASSYFSKLPIPERARELVLAGPVETEATIAASRDALDILVLSGSPGCGKTIAAALWLHRFIVSPERWVYDDRPDKPLKKGEVFYGCSKHPRFTVSAPIWITAARLSRQDRYDEEAMGALLTTERLVIDDLGGEYLDKNGFYMGLLDEIVNERQGNKQATVLTTNLNLEKFHERYGERIYDRIKQGGRFVACGNVSMRKATS
jgi:DNA replication protein DnaC